MKWVMTRRLEHDASKEVTMQILNGYEHRYSVI